MNPSDQRALAVIATKHKIALRNADKISLLEALLHNKVKKAADSFRDSFYSPRPSCDFFDLPPPPPRLTRSIATLDPGPPPPLTRSTATLETLDQGPPHQPNIWFSSTLFEVMVKKSIQHAVRPQTVKRKR